MSAEPAGRRGLPASPGIAIGPAYVLRRERLVVPEHRIAEGDEDAEVTRLEAAFEQTQRDLREIRGDMETTGLVGDVFDAQFLFLEDPTLLEHARESVREQRVNAEWALQRELRRLQSVFAAMADPYIRERASDVGFVVRRVLQVLMGREPEGLQNAPPGVIVVAEDLSPGEVAQIKRDQVVGLITETGTRTSHVAIMARSLEIPAVVGAGPGLAAQISDGDIVVVDGRDGDVRVEPDPETIDAYRQRQRRDAVLSRELLRYVDLPAETRDGVAVGLLANVDQVDEVPDALRYGAEGIGLFRTEFLFMNRRDLPCEEEQLATYREILEAMAPRSVVMRTLDLGGEKVPSGLDLAEEPNPALGLRGVRMYRNRPQVFRTQLRALLRASRFGRLKILVPMVSSVVEVDSAVQTLAHVRDELRVQGERFDDKVQLGVMIETPAAAMIADLIAPRADFLSIGTNDLLQYTLAVDRTNEQVAYLYEPLHPAHLRMISRISQAARRAGIVLGMCGEMAGDPVHCWVLLALGVGDLSMAPFAIPMLKKIVRDSTLAEARELLAEILQLPAAAEIRTLVRQRMAARFPSEFEPTAPEQ